MPIPRNRLVVLVALAGGAVLGAAGPAGAASPVLADDQFKWFYWAGPLIALGLIGVLAAVGVGYYLRVMRPKWRGRQAP